MRRAANATPQRLALAVVVAISAMAAACSDEGGTATTTTSPPPTSEPAASAGALIPEVLCISAYEPFDVAFAYTNESDTAVVVAADASTMTGAEAADALFVPRVFAPGRLAPAFWVTATSPTTGPLPAWTVVGPDGVSRTAAVDASTPACAAEHDASILADPRTVRVEIDDVAASADGTSVTFTARLSGADASVCPEGLDPQPPQITWDDGADGSAVDGPTSSWTVPLGEGQQGRQRVAVLVIEQCASDGTTQAIWASSEALGNLYRGIEVCVDGGGGSPVVVTSQDENPGDCFPLAPTGGGRIRPA